MSQITTGLRSILSSPRIYDYLQDLMGARSGRRELVCNHVRPLPGSRILDIGCGTARILDYLPEVEYYGFDLSQVYINAATKRYDVRGHFNRGLVEQAVVEHMPPFDIVLAIGLLHHLDDESAVGLMRLARSALHEGGRLITIDPCYADDQSVLSRFLVSRDRGQNIRDLAGYSSLARSAFDKIIPAVRHRAWIPYTHCIMVCEK